MSSVAFDTDLDRATGFYQATIGKKVVMAVTGVILFGYLVGHLLGNLQIYLGAEQMDNYAAFLHSIPVLLWRVRLVLLGMHLYHGLWSMFQSVGFSHPRYTPVIKRAATWIAILMAAGFISIPFAVMTGLVGSNL